MDKIANNQLIYNRLMISFILFLYLQTFTSTSRAIASQDPLAGLYVNDFPKIINNEEREDSLLSYANANGFSYLMLYNLHIVNQTYNLTDIISSQPLADFIRKAKTKYGIKQIGGSSGNYQFFKTTIDVYNEMHTDPLERIDVYNLENEYWNEKDPTAAFSSYISILRKINTLAHSRGVISEAYVGWTTRYQSIQIGTNCDRVLLHAYVSTDDKVYSYTRERLTFFGAGTKVINMMIIFNSKEEFMGPWLTTNSIKKPFQTFIKEFNNDSGAWKSRINLLGYQWYNYTNMPKTKLPDVISSTYTSDEVSESLTIFPNPSSSEVIISFAKPVSGMVSVYNGNGEEVISNNVEHSIHSHKLELSDLPKGIYWVTITSVDTIWRGKVIKE